MNAHPFSCSVANRFWSSPRGIASKVNSRSNPSMETLPLSRHPTSMALLNSNSKNLTRPTTPPADGLRQRPPGRPLSVDRFQHHRQENYPAAPLPIVLAPPRPRLCRNHRRWTVRHRRPRPKDHLQGATCRETNRSKTIKIPILASSHLNYPSDWISLDINGILFKSLNVFLKRGQTARKASAGGRPAKRPDRRNR